ncbi:hypothetical protein H8959_005977 [Pygathrix nigripes]
MLQGDLHVTWRSRREGFDLLSWGLAHGLPSSWGVACDCGRCAWDSIPYSSRNACWR